jgi:hypothetical protein
MNTIYSWFAVRSGAAMTITGRDEAGAQVKLTGVTLIMSGERGICATVGTESFFLQAVNPADRPPACIACNIAFVDDDLVHTDESGCFIHASCCGPERESYVKAGGEPLGPEDPIPTPFRWGGLPQAISGEAA